MPPRQRYNDEQKAACLLALEANGGDVTATAAETGIGNSTIANWKRGIGISERTQAILNERKPRLLDRMETLAHSLLDHFPRKMRKATLPQLTLALATLLEKMQLLGGLPTSIQGTLASGADDPRMKQVLDILETAKKRMDAQKLPPPSAAAVSPESAAQQSGPGAAP